MTNKINPISNIKSDLRQINLLIWKNFKFLLRSPIGLIIELIIPAFLAFVLLPFRQIVKSEIKANYTKFELFNLTQPPFQNSVAFYEFVYQPNDSFLLNKIMKDVGFNLNLKILGNSKFKFSFR
jgi:hypothetical protein